MVLIVHVQLGKRKNMLEIELNESLRRRRNELNAKIDALGEAESGDSSAAEELEKKRRELDALNKSIENLTKRTQGGSLFQQHLNLADMST